MTNTSEHYTRKLMKSTFVLLFIVSYLSVCNARASKLPTAAKAKLHHIIGKLENAGAQVGLEIDDLGTVKNPQQFPVKSPSAPKVLFSYRARQSYMSASNWKLFTAFFALGSNDNYFPRDTCLFTFAPISQTGVLNGNLILSGFGDPSLNVEQLHDTALALKSKGLRKITGTVIPALSMLNAETLGGRYPFGWTLDDALWYYAPPIGGLAINRNQVDVVITGGDKLGDAATVTYSPELPGIKIKSYVGTGESKLNKENSDDLLHWNRFEDADDTIFVSGSVAPGQRITEGIAIPNPDLVAAKVLAEQLQLVGIEVNTPTGKDPAHELDSGILNPATLYMIPAPPLKVLLTHMLKTSDNLYAEMIVRSVSASMMSIVRPHLFALLKENGINTVGLRMEDGSGLSRYSLITPQAMTQLLNAAQKLPKDRADIFWNALPIAGVDGTLGKRMKSTFAQNNVRAKTGTFSTACNLSGYVTTRDGHRLAVSFLTNFGPATDVCRDAQDEVFEDLAEMRMR